MKNSRTLTNENLFSVKSPQISKYFCENNMGLCNDVKVDVNLLKDGDEQEDIVVCAKLSIGKIQKEAGNFLISGYIYTPSRTGRLNFNEIYSPEKDDFLLNTTLGNNCMNMNKLKRYWSFVNARRPVSFTEE